MDSQSDTSSRDHSYSPILRSDVPLHGWSRSESRVSIDQISTQSLHESGDKESIAIFRQINGKFEQIGYLHGGLKSEVQDSKSESSSQTSVPTESPSNDSSEITDIGANNSLLFNNPEFYTRLSQQILGTVANVFHNEYLNETHFNGSNADCWAYYQNNICHRHECPFRHDLTYAQHPNALVRVGGNWLKNRLTHP